MNELPRRVWIVGGLLAGGFLIPAVLASWLAPADPFAVNLAEA
ncbi:MAG: nickel ABC transporter permease subunit NikC, partial [SAR324 cluster bacterium]|nr:nickel ABC transporter permease subunit NikC [SAR324 cluster bacterium]